MTEAAKTMPCPFCGGDQVRPSALTGAMFCEGCGCEGPWAPHFDGDWNTRAPVSAPTNTVAMLRAALAPFADESIFAGPQHDYVTVARSACDAAKAALDATAAQAQPVVAQPSDALRAERDELQAELNRALAEIESLDAECDRRHAIAQATQDAAIKAGHDLFLAMNDFQDRNTYLSRQARKAIEDFAAAISSLSLRAIAGGDA